MNSLCNSLRYPGRQAVWKYMAVGFTGLFIFFSINRIGSDYPRTVLNHVNAISPIPNSVHFVYILDDPEKDLVFPFSHFLSVFSTEYYWQPDEIFLHTNAVPTVLDRARLGESGKWSRLIFNMPNFRVVSITAPTSAGNGREIQLIEHKSDFARVEAVRKYGGTYLDFDAFALRDIKVLRHSGFNAICGKSIIGDVISGTFMSKKGSKLIDGWSEMMGVVFDGQWTTHSNGVVEKVANALVPQAGEVLIMEQNAFAPGSWYAEDTIRMFEVHDETPSSLPDIQSGNYKGPLADDLETPDTNPPSWATDWSATYILHGYKPSRSGASPPGFTEITPRYVLQKQSNFARAVYRAALAMIQRGFLSEEDFNDEVF
ncbi:hypothetical protein MY11210_001640 [Beauveria gryllotalpidicola]